MKLKISQKSSSNEDDLAVRKDVIDSLFDPPLGRSTFYKYVNKGLIVKARFPSGYYLLNATRRNNNIEPLDVAEYHKRVRESDTPEISPAKRLVYVAMRELLPDLIPRLYPPSFIPESITEEESTKIEEMYAVFGPRLETMDILEQIYYAAGAIWAEEESNAERQNH